MDTTSALVRESKATDLNKTLLNKGMHMMICHSTQTMSMNHLSVSGGRLNDTMPIERESTVSRF